MIKLDFPTIDSFDDRRLKSNSILLNALDKAKKLMFRSYLRNRSIFVRSAFAFLFCLTILFYGCSQEKKRENSAQNEQDSPIVSSLSKEEGNSVSTELPDDDSIADALGNATNEFANMLSSSQDAADEDRRELSVDPTIRDRYIIDVAPGLVPQLVRDAESETDASSNADSDATEGDETTKYSLKYKYQPGEEICWRVLHRVQKKLSIGATTSGIETLSEIMRRWNVLENADGEKVRCEYKIDRMILHQMTDDKDPVSFNSETDETVPQEFAIFGTDRTIGTVLERFNIDSLGVMTDKEILVPEFNGSEADTKVLVPFPKEEVAVGDSWTLPYTILLKGKDDAIRSYQGVLKFSLVNVQDDLAMIRFRTTLLSVVADPIVEGQLAEKLFKGVAVFDIRLGKILKTELEYSKSVPNAFGEPSHLEYYCHLTEEWIR